MKSATMESWNKWDFIFVLKNSIFLIGQLPICLIYKDKDAVSS